MMIDEPLPGQNTGQANFYGTVTPAVIAGVNFIKLPAEPERAAGDQVLPGVKDQ